MVEPDLQQEVEQFLYREARLLSECRYDDWLDLLTEDMSYWMPARETVEGGAGVPAERGTMPVFEDDKPFLRARVERLKSSLAHAEQPPSRLRYFVSNVEIEQSSNAAQWDVRCNLLVYQSRLERTETLYAGYREDRLRREEGGLRLAKRKIVLDQTLVPRTISIFF